MAAAVVLTLNSMQAQEPEVQLEAATHMELVASDLRGAIERYQSLSRTPGVPRSIAAAALLRMARCLEKLGNRTEARAAYERLIRDYADQPASASARSRLAEWTAAPPVPRNLSFTQAGLSGWKGSATATTQGCKTSSCVVVKRELSQTVSAIKYRGKTVRLRAAIRMESGGSARLFLRNEVGQPFSSDHWQNAEIIREIDKRDETFDLGIRAYDGGIAVVDELSFDVVAEGEIETARRALQDVYARLDTFYREGFSDNEIAAAAKVPVVSAGLPNPFVEFLKYPGDAPSVRTTINKVHLTENGVIAITRTDFTTGTATFRDKWQRAGQQWRLTSRTFLTGHYNDAPTNTATTKLIAADLRRHAAPLATAEPGHTFYDLAPLGNAIGDKRAVILHDTASGTRESAEIRHRLLEYLVKEKGFLAYVGATTPEMKAWMESEHIAAAPGPDKKTLIATTQPVKRDSQVYVIRIAMQSGRFLARGYHDGAPTDVAEQSTGTLPEGTGDAVLAAANMPLFFLDFRSVPAMTTLGLWLVQPHLFLDTGAIWNRDDSANHLRITTLPDDYDGIIFIREGHAPKKPEVSRAK